MGIREYGNPPISSTQGLTTDPSTSALVAELTGLEDRLYEVRWAIGASTGGIWRLELAASTALGTFRDRTIVYTGSNITSEFIFAYKAESGDRLRIVPQSSFTGNCFGKISAEVLI